MPKDFYQIATASAEHVSVAGMRVTLEGLLHLQSKSIHTPAHIRSAGGQPDPHPSGRRHRSRRTEITRRSPARLTPSSTHTRTPLASSISINPAGLGAAMLD